jgi:hypothetical protein
MMRSQQVVQSNPEVKRVVEDLLSASSKFDRYENRSAIREPLVLPVEIDFREGEEPLLGFSRNVSLTGIGLVMPEGCIEKKIALLTIERLHQKDSVKLLAECRWVKEYSQKWFYSGWQFINVKR